MEILEHDQYFCHIKTTQMSEDDKELLQKLGYRVDEHGTDLGVDCEAWYRDFSLMSGPFDVVLLEKEGDSALTREEIIGLMTLAKLDELDPIEIPSKNVESTAMGFITRSAYDKLDFYLDDLSDFVTNIMDDMENENKYFVYLLKYKDYALNVALARNIDDVSVEDWTDYTTDY